MVLQRWDPMFDLRRMHEAMNRRRHEHAPALVANGHRGWAIPLDVVEEGEELLVRASIPGVNPDEIDVSIEDRVLTIKAETKSEEESKEGGYFLRERHTGSFRRSILLPETADTEKAKTLYETGVLTVALPKVESKKAKHPRIILQKELACAWGQGNKFLNKDGSLLGYAKTWRKSGDGWSYFDYLHVLSLPSRLEAGTCGGRRMAW